MGWGMLPGMARVVWMVLDSLGIGGAPDAAEFGDEGADTLGHICRFFYEERGRILVLPTLHRKLGLGEAYRLIHDELPMGWEAAMPLGIFAAATEVSRGKDTPSGHWEMAGLPVTWDWHYFPETLPEDLIAEVCEVADVPGSLANCAGSGVTLIEQFGEESMATGKPIFYTSADSVFQVAAHEKSFGLGRLQRICVALRKHFDYQGIPLGRVVARPFVGEPGAFKRTGNRRDYALAPPKETVLEKIEKAGGTVHAIGKVGDIFAHTGIGHEIKADGFDDLWARTRQTLTESKAGDVVFTNFVDFDSVFGHRRDPRGYGRALEDFDRELGPFLEELKTGDLLVITADHGNDPTWPGSDHTRERVPVLVYGAGRGDRGIRETFADIGATVADWLGVKVDEGTSIL